MAATGGERLKLLGSITSPFVRKVRVVAMELGLGDRLELVPTETSDPALGLINPLGKVPALLLADGTALYDSAVIVEYLDHLGGGTLLPVAGPARWPVLVLQALADGMADAAVYCVMEKRRPPAARSADALALQRGKMLRGLDRLEADVASLDALNAGTIAAAVTLGYFDFRHPDLGWRAERPKLARWYESQTSRPAMLATAPPEA